MAPPGGASFEPDDVQQSLSSLARVPENDPLAVGQQGGRPRLEVSEGDLPWGTRSRRKHPDLRSRADEGPLSVLRRKRRTGFPRPVGWAAARHIA